MNTELIEVEQKQNILALQLIQILKNQHHQQYDRYADSRASIVIENYDPSQPNFIEKIMGLNADETDEFARTLLNNRQFDDLVARLLAFDNDSNVEQDTLLAAFVEDMFLNWYQSGKATLRRLILTSLLPFLEHYIKSLPSSCATQTAPQKQQRVQAMIESILLCIYNTEVFERKNKHPYLSLTTTPNKSNNKQQSSDDEQQVGPQTLTFIAIPSQTEALLSTKSIYYDFSKKSNVATLRLTENALKEHGKKTKNGDKANETSQAALQIGLKKGIHKLRKDHHAQFLTAIATEPSRQKVLKIVLQVYSAHLPSLSPSAQQRYAIMCYNVITQGLLFEDQIHMYSRGKAPTTTTTASSNSTHSTTNSAAQQQHVDFIWVDEFIAGFKHDSNKNQKNKPNKPRIHLKKSAINEMITGLNYCLMSKVQGGPITVADSADSQSLNKIYAVNALCAIHVRALYEQSPELLMHTTSLIRAWRERPAREVNATPISYVDVDVVDGDANNNNNNNNCNSNSNSNNMVTPRDINITFVENVQQ